ncbi:MAG: polyprenyl synthetase family protein [Bacteroidia bacterium]
MYNYNELYQLIENKIKETVYGSNPKELYEPISYMMSLGGKRLRPVLTLMGCNVFNDNVNNAIPAALAIEVFHNFTLVHDDIMDNAPLRRGKETVYKKWNTPIAILSGDLMMIKSIDFLIDTNFENIPHLIKIFNKTAREVCEGQQIDMNFETQKDVTHEQYIEMTTLKTAVLLGAALQLGALIGGANKYDAEHLYQFGKNIGIAFQIQDDILDAFGDGSKTGKKVGGDIDSNKKTLLLIELIQCVHKDDKILLNQLLNETNTDKKIEGVINLYNKYQIKEFAETQKQQYLDKAFNHLKSVNVEENKKQYLINTANELMQRIS